MDGFFFEVDHLRDGVRLAETGREEREVNRDRCVEMLCHRGVRLLPVLMLVSRFPFNGLRQ